MNKQKAMENPLRAAAREDAIFPEEFLTTDASDDIANDILNECYFMQEDFLFELSYLIDSQYAKDERFFY